MQKIKLRSSFLHSIQHWRIVFPLTRWYTYFDNDCPNLEEVVVKKLSLSTRFTLILSGIFLLGIAIGGTAYWRALQGTAQQEIALQGLLLIENMNAVRNYTTDQVKPLLAQQLASSPTFISESVPAFSARTVFDNFRSQKNFSSYRYKEAAISPTSPVDQADDFEAGLLQSMAASKSAQVSGYRDVSGTRLFYIARPLTVGSDSCLQCHGSPAAAPASQIATYGNSGGFNWKLGQVVAVQIIYVPATAVFNTAWQNFTLVMSVFIAIFALIILLINVLLRRYVIEPVNVLGGLAQKISADEDFASALDDPKIQAVTTRSDELGNLAQVFRKMAKEVYERTGKLKEQVKQLTITIDHMRRNQEVAEVVGSDFFNDLKKRAGELRKRGDN
jgi:methyl-accepting chemotaxis protein